MGVTADECVCNSLQVKFHSPHDSRLNATFKSMDGRPGLKSTLPVMRRIIHPRNLFRAELGFIL